LLVAFIMLWQIICSARLNVSEFIFPSPWRIWPNKFWEFQGRDCKPRLAHLWVTMVGFGIAIVVGVLLGFVIGSSRLAYAACTR
jgi:NitT/TauT family transport system permease protein